MARSRRKAGVDTSATVQVEDNNVLTTKESTVMSNTVFEPLSAEEWQESGAGATAEKGEYGRILVAFVESGQRYAKISTAADAGGRFAGRKASSIGTALKNARDSKTAPDGVGENIRITSKDGAVYLENEDVAA
jgi:hypothetical protein